MKWMVIDDASIRETEGDAGATGRSYATKQEAALAAYEYANQQAELWRQRSNAAWAVYFKEQERD